MLKRSVICIIILSLVFVSFILPVFAADKQDISDTYFNSMKDLIKDRYKGDVTDEQNTINALKGMFGNLDPYTQFFTKKEAESFFGDINGNYKGIGVMIGKAGNFVVVEKVFNDSPAQKAAIIIGDRFATIDGKTAIGLSTDEVANLVRGMEGTTVEIGMIRGASTEILKFKVERREITVNPVSYSIEKGIGYLKLEQFNTNALKNIKIALAYFDKNNIKKVIFDLRDNPGGDLDQAVGISKLFVTKGLITKVDYKATDETDQEYYSELVAPKYKLVVLINKNSASASEIFSGAIQDTKSGTLVGVKSYGKAKVQKLIPLLTQEAFEKYSEQTGKPIVNIQELMIKNVITPLDSELIGWIKMTVGEYYTPLGRMIDKRGLVPDVLVENTDEANLFKFGEISKLSKANNYTLGSESNEIFKVEEMLKLLGYNIDNADNNLDKNTFAEIKKFQKNNRIAMTGILGSITQEALNKSIQEKVYIYDKQFAKALELLK